MKTIFCAMLTLIGLALGTETVLGDTIGRLTNAEVERNDGKIIVKCKDGADRVNVRKLSNGRIELTVNGSRMTFTQTEAFGMEIRGGDGNDTITADRNITFGLVLKGDDDNDTIRGGSGNDEIRGGDDDDVLDGGGGNDDIEGGSGNDRITGGGGYDDVNGNGGNDTFVGRNGAVREKEVVRVVPAPTVRRYPRRTVVIRP